MALDQFANIAEIVGVVVVSETRKAIVLFNVFMIDTESRYYQFQSGYLDAQSWEGRLGTLPELVRLPVYQLWKKSFGGLSHSADFLALLESQSES